MDLNITQEAAGHTPEGLPLSIFTLSNRHGMAVKLSTRGAALLSLHVPDRHGQLANVLRGGQPNDGIHLLPAPGRALHRLAWHAVPLVDDASVGVRLVSPGAPAVVAVYRLDDANTLTLRCEVATEVPAMLCMLAGFNLAGEGVHAEDVGGHLLMVRAGRVVPAGEHEQEARGTVWDCRLPRALAELPGAARYLTGARAAADREESEAEGLAPSPAPGGALVLRLLDPPGGRQLELAGDLASVRLARDEAPSCLALECALAAPGGELALHFSAQT